MENKYVGWIIIGISMVMGLMVVLFNTSLKDIIDATCSHGPECSMYSTLEFQTGFSSILILIILIIGLVIMFKKPEEKIVIKKVKEKTTEKKIDKSKLDSEEKNIVELIEKENGAMFQKTLMEKLEIGKVKTTRLLDKLEAKQIIERKRRGMNNIVVLKR